MEPLEVERFAMAEEASLLRYAFLLTGSSSAAEDLVQSAFTKLLTTKRSVRTPAAYARRIILNEYRDEFRRRRHHEVPVAEDRPLDDLAIDHAWLWVELKRLPTRQRAVLVLRHYEGLSDSAIAKIVGCRQPTVRSLAARGLSALRARMKLDASPDMTRRKD